MIGAAAAVPMSAVGLRGSNRLDSSQPPRLLKRIGINGSVRSLAVAGRTVWLGVRPFGQAPGRLGRTAFGSNRVTLVGRAGAFPDAIALTSHAVWIANGLGGSPTEARGARNVVFRVLPKSGRLVARVLVRNPHAAIAAYGSVWLASSARNRERIAELDQRTNRIVKVIPLRGQPGAAQLAAGAGSIWVLTTNTGSSGRGATVTRIDARTRSVLHTTNLAGGTDIAFGAGHLWIAAPTAGTRFFAELLELDPHGNQLLPRHVPLIRATSIAFGGGSVWVTGANTVSRVRVASGAASFVVSNALKNGLEVAATTRGAWVADGASANLFLFR
jgi:DNA-binding beta-propeller fold protein YncE